MANGVPGRLGACIPLTRSENTEAEEGKGRQKPVQSAGNTAQIIRNQPSVRGKAYTFAPDRTVKDFLTIPINYSYQ